jgi:leader peptidase (prepilin peptidase)/N-methyltransferase
MASDPFIVLAQAVPLWVYLHVPTAVFVFCFGACVGSFMNVVIYRLPAGISVISPPSRCPTCGARLSWRENLPIIGWALVRGKCRYCAIPLSLQYVAVELFMALLFAGLYVLLFVVPPSTPWWGAIGGSWWHWSGLFDWRGAMLAGAWPSFIAWSFLFAGLTAMTIIDARTFTIPIQIPVVVTLTAFAAYGVQALFPTPPAVGRAWPIPPTNWPWSGAAMGGMAGVVLAIALLRRGILRQSFADYHEHVKAGDVLGDYPHARREMVREAAFLAPIVACAVLGWCVGRLADSPAPPVWVQALGGAILGYLVGGGIVWMVRMLGTLAFGREAMGLGDVHLLAAVGAVLGWRDPIWVFFLAPFLGLGWHVVSMPLARVMRGVRRELPYGPHLAVATLLVVLGRPGLDRAWTAITGQPPPGPPLLHAVAEPAAPE